MYTVEGQNGKMHVKLSADDFIYMVKYNILEYNQKIRRVMNLCLRNFFETRIVSTLEHAINIYYIC